MSASDIPSRESLESQVQALTDLIEVAKAVVSTIDLDTVLQSILTSAMHFAATPAGTLAAYDEKKKEFTLHSYEGLSAAFAKKECWDVMPGGLTEQVLESVDIFFIEDVSQATYLNGPVELAEGIKSLICIPLRVQDEVVGILHLADFVPRQFDREKMRLLSVFASFASMAIYNAKIHNRTKILAITDGLTGLYNHRYFRHIFSQEIRRAKRYRKCFAILMIDVDDFKKFNDKYGHPTGDLILVEIAKIISRKLRKVDFAFRYGGEEFIVLLPEAGLDSARLAAERLREAIERETVEVLREETSEGVTVSIGVACYPEDGSDRGKLFKVVDELLYKAKLFGKNKVYYLEKGSEASGSHETMRTFISIISRSCFMVTIIVPLLLTGCIKGLYEGENTVLRPEIIKYKGTTDTPKPPTKEICPEPGEAVRSDEEREKHPAPEKPCPPVEEKLLPQELPVQSPQQLMPIPPPVLPKSPERPQSSLADPARLLAEGPPPDFSYRDAILTEDVVWRGEVHITGVVTVAPQSTLTVEQGTVLRFGGRRDKSVQNSFLLVYGRVVVRGTREKPVLFTSRFAQSMADDWQGIAMLGSEKKNLLENCRIEGAETGLDSSYSTVTLKNVHFNRCGMGARLRDTVVFSTGGGASGCIVGLYLTDSEAEIRDAGVSGNRQGVVAERSSLYLAGGTFSRNDLEALKTTDSKIKIAGGNFTVNGAGLAIVSSQGSLSGAKITGNADYGALLANSRVKVYGNEIARNGGAGLKVEDGKGVAWGNSIYANGEYDLVNDGTEEFRAMGNWWGAADFSAIGKRIYDRQTDSGRGRVFYTPVLTDNPLALL